jgi:PhnB protein
MSVKAIPEGFHTVTPYLGVKGAAEAIEFYKEAFGAVEVFRLSMPDGKIGHAELRLGDSPLMLCEPCGQGAFGSPEDAAGKVSCSLHLYVEDVDASFERAVAAGARVVQPVADQFYGNRTGTLKDPFGHVWFVATRKEQLSGEEVTRRANEMFKQTQS